MIYSTLVVVASALAGFASATTNFTSCCAVDPTTVDSPTRAAWCRAQTNTCPLLCPNGSPTENSCDSNALTYTCTCGSGNAPNVSAYAQTLPSLECQEWEAQCTLAHPNDLTGQTFCQSFVCGTLNATALAVSSSAAAGSASTPAPSGTASGSAAASATSSTAATKSSGAAVALNLGKEYGTGAVAVGLLALFGLAL